MVVGLSTNDVMTKIHNFTVRKETKIPQLRLLCDDLVFVMCA